MTFPPDLPDDFTTADRFDLGDDPFAGDDDVSWATVLAAVFGIAIGCVAFLAIVAWSIFS